MHAINALDYDWLTAHLDTVLPDDSLAILSSITSGTNRHGIPYQSGRLTPDVFVSRTDVGTTISGSPHKYALGESIGVCGPPEIYTFARDVAGRLGLPLAAILDGRVTRFDLGANLHIDYDVTEFLRLVSAPPQMEELMFRRGTKTFKNTLRQVTFYDKTGKIRDTRRAHLIPDDWEDGRVLRVEVRFTNMGKEFGRPVTVRDLCDQAFYEEASARWLRWVLGVRVQEGVWALPLGRGTVPEVRDAYAAAGIAQTGGRVAARRRIDAARKTGTLTSVQASRQRKWVDDMTRVIVVDIEDCDATIQQTISGAFKDAVTAAASPRRR